MFSLFGYPLCIVWHHEEFCLVFLFLSSLPSLSHLISRLISRLILSYLPRHPTGIVVGSLLVALGLVAVVGVKYRQSQEEVDSKGGYWRAPSIQAMLFDDSAHEDDRLNTHTMSDESSSAGGGGGGGGGGRGVPLGRVVEMGDMSMDKSACSGSGSGYTTTTATAIPVTLSPIPSDEIRV